DGPASPRGRLRARVRSPRAGGRARRRAAGPHGLLRPSGRAAGRHRYAGVGRRRHGRRRSRERPRGHCAAPARRGRGGAAGRGRGGRSARLGAAAPAHADAHHPASAVQRRAGHLRHGQPDRRGPVAPRFRLQGPAAQGVVDGSAERAGRGRPPRGRAVDHRGGAGRRARLGADALGAAAARRGPNPLGADRAGGRARGPPALRRNARAFHRRDRPRGGDEAGEQGQAEPARVRRAGGGGL
ncbi:MAG: Ser-tRNA(Ala) deacylase @ Gly-tRNA(Ala) deacylase, partial [uncultured Acetobacteraceae bacterium]